MNLDNLIEMQRGLDSKIREEKGLKDVDLVANTYVALQVELAEFANEARWFKHWSENQEPSKSILTTQGATNENAEFFECMNDDCKQISHKKDFGNLFEPDYDVCPKCQEGAVYAFRKKYPLLEEYIDGFHFFLSLAIQKGWEDSLYLHEEAILDLQDEGFDGGLSGVYLEMIYYLNKSYMENNRSEKIEKTFNKTVQEFNFNTAWFLFIAIGLIGFEFTEEQIEQAYIDKNKVNHERQENGY